MAVAESSNEAYTETSLQVCMYKAALVAFVMLGLPVASAQAGELRLSIANGRVTIVAQ